MKSILMSSTKKKLSIAGCLLIIGLVSCKKESNVGNPTTPTVNKFEAINTASSFNWSSENKIAFSFTGIAVNSYNAILKVTTPDGNVIFQKLQKGDENYSGTIVVPANYETINVQFGGVKKNFTVKNGVVNMILN